MSRHRSKFTVSAPISCRSTRLCVLSAQLAARSTTYQASSGAISN